MTDMTVALEILRQLGGRGRLTAMIGANGFSGDGNSLTIKFSARAKGRINCIRITLTPADTYTVEFLKVNYKELEVVTVHVSEDVYCDTLQDVIERRTGLYLSL